MTLRLFNDEPAYVPDLGQYHTPPKLAWKMATEFYPLLHGAVVLEPSAGGGALVQAALRVGAEHVVACEIDPAWCRKLRERFAGQPVTVIEGDFLALDPSDERLFPKGRNWMRASLSNPPYNDGFDTNFLAALLHHGSWWYERSSVGKEMRHVSLLNNSALAGIERYERVWSKARLLGVRHLCRRPAFGAEEGWQTGSKDMVVLDFTDGGRASWTSPTIEWWPESWNG